MNTNEQYKLEVTPDDCGPWIPAYEVRNFDEFMIRVVDLAIDNGFDISEDWAATRAIVSAHAADDETSMAMNDFYSDALSYMNSIIPENFYFYPDSRGLVLMDDEGTYPDEWSDYGPE